MLGKWPESSHWGMPEAMSLRSARSYDFLKPLFAPLYHWGCRPALLYRPPLQSGPWRAARQGPQHTRCRIAATPTDVFVVDFDGVLCNTEPEVSCDMHGTLLNDLTGGFISLLPAPSQSHLTQVDALCSYPYLATEALPNTGQISLQKSTRQSNHKSLMP